MQEDVGAAEEGSVLHVVSRTWRLALTEKTWPSRRDATRTSSAHDAAFPSLSEGTTKTSFQIICVCAYRISGSIISGDHDLQTRIDL